MTAEEIGRLQDEIIKAVQERNYPRARDLVAKATSRGEKDGDLRDLLERERKLNKELQEKLEQAKIPPLTRMFVLGHSPDDDQNVIVGSGSQRIEVRLAPDARVERAEIRPEAEAWLNEEHQLMKVRPAHNIGETAEVSSVLDDGRIEVRYRGNDQLIVHPVAALAESGIQAGDRLRIDAGMGVALEKLPAETSQELELEEVPDVSYEQIGGLDQHIEQIRDAIELPYLYHRLFARYKLRRPKGILLYGPPGCGKTMLAKAIANSLSKEISRNLRDLEKSLRTLSSLRTEASDERRREVYAEWETEIGREDSACRAGDAEEPTNVLEGFLRSRGVEVSDDLSGELERVRSTLAANPKAFFMSIKGPELLNKWVGETEHSIRRLFIQAKRKASPATPVVMFFDEIEALFRRRGSRTSSDMESTVVPQFLSEIDGVEELRDVIIIGATNRQDLLDAAILRPGRLDTKIKVERPNRDASASIFRKYVTDELPLGDAASTGTEAAINGIVGKAVDLLFATGSVIFASGKRIPNGEKTLRCSGVMSGAMIENIVGRAKKRAVRREISGVETGLLWEDIREAIFEELNQNKDQLIAQELQMSEEDFVAEVRLSTGGEPVASELTWFEPIPRPWVQG